MKAFYERSLEQISVLENNKQLAIQQHDLAEQEKVRLRAEVDRLRDVSSALILIFPLDINPTGMVLSIVLEQDTSTHQDNINPYLMNGLAHLYHRGESTFI